jgi:hypothetical protein
MWYSFKAIFSFISQAKVKESSFLSRILTNPHPFEAGWLDRPSLSKNDKAKATA